LGKVFLELYEDELIDRQRTFWSAVEEIHHDAPAFRCAVTIHLLYIPVPFRTPHEALQRWQRQKNCNRLALRAERNPAARDEASATNRAIST
ncbi:hypothetical protein KCU79_g156, partial [Aureobasidium melanogenum]